MNYWIFKGNPDRYNIDARLRNPEARTTWNVTRYKTQIEPGDIAFIWRTGKPNGIVAVMEINSAPAEMDEISPDDAYWSDPRETTARWRVVGRFTHRGPMVPREKILTTPGLEDLSVFRGFQQATNLKVTPAEGRTLMRLVEGRPLHSFLGQQTRTG